MLQVLNAGSTELSCPRGGTAVMLNCWEKPSPLIKELERTVNFAERKCGDLMQQLNFYKEYYEKWSHTERVSNAFQKKKTKKCYRQAQDNGSSSKSDFEKANLYFYKKIKRKINEMSNEVSKVNQTLNIGNENQGLFPKVDLPADPLPPEVSNAAEPEIAENKLSKSESSSFANPNLASFTNKESSNVAQANDKKEIKVTGKPSSKSMPARRKNCKKDCTKKMDFGSIKRRYSSLQRYKIRSKSLPQGVRRKFGFGSFVEVFDPKATHNETFSTFSKSKTTIKTTSSKSLKTLKSDGKSKTRLSESNRVFSHKLRGNSLKSSRSFHYRLRNTKTDVWPARHSDKNFISKDVKSESAVTRRKTHLTQEQNATFRNICQKSENDSNTNEVSRADNVDKKGSRNSFSKDGFNPLDNLSTLIAKPNALIPFLRNPIPFIPCSSTSKTFNLGLNVQQVLALIKHKRHSITLQAIVKNGMQAARALTVTPEPTVNTLFISQTTTTTTSHGHVTSAICPARECSEDGISIFADNIYCHSKCSMLKQVQSTRSRAIEEGRTQSINVTGNDNRLPRKLVETKKVERPEDVWVVDQPDPNLKGLKKIQSRCTCFPSKHCVDYHKVLRQYTRWMLPESKAESYTSEEYSTFDPMISCPKSKLCPIPSLDNVELNLCQSDGKIELAKVHDDLINLNRKYSSLQEQISQNNLDDFEASAELDAMESELAIREVEMSEIIKFYKQLMLLKDRLKSLRTKNGHSMSQSASQQNQRLKKDPLRPTPSMALTKILRKIQGLQDKIKLIDAP